MAKYIVQRNLVDEDGSYVIGQEVDWPKAKADEALEKGDILLVPDSTPVSPKAAAAAKTSKKPQAKVTKEEGD